MIDTIKINLLAFPVKKPFSNHAHSLTVIHGIEVRIYSGQHLGCSFIYGPHKMPYTNVATFIKNEVALALFKIKTSSNLQNEWNHFWLSYKRRALVQDQLYALAAIHIAVGDLVTKAQNSALHQHLGAAHNKIPVYATTGWLSFSTQELIEECQSYTLQGIRAFKVRLGHAEDFARLQALRATMGEEFIIMADANQRYTAEKAAEVSNQLMPLNIYWLEEPTRYLPEEVKHIRNRSKLPIAWGENSVEESDFEELCKNKLTDYLQPDLPRCGGITGFSRAAKIAQRYQIPLCSHLMPQLSVSLVAAFPKGAWVEYDNLLPEGLFIEPFRVEEGMMQPPSCPGTGVDLTEEALKEFSTVSYILTPS